MSIASSNQDIEDPLLRLRRLDSCAVSDALDKLGIANGVATGLEQRAARRRITGRVVTMRLVPSPVPLDLQNKPRHLGTTAIERARAGDIIVIEQRSELDAGCWGGILTLGAKLKGVAGVIADGPVRDIDEARDHDFPIYSRACTPRTARGRVVEVEVNGPVTIGVALVRANDFAIADASGVVFIPADRIDEVLSAAEMIAGREALMTKALLGGQAIPDVMGASYEHMLK